MQIPTSAARWPSSQARSISMHCRLGADALGERDPWGECVAQVLDTTPGSRRAEHSVQLEHCTPQPRSVYRDGELVAEPNGERERVTVARCGTQNVDAVFTGHRPSYGGAARHT